MNIQCPNCFEKFDSGLGICPNCGYTEGEHATEALHMDPGTILHDRYHIGRVLGFGGFGVTYLAWDEILDSRVAIKEYLPSEFSTRAVGASQVTIFSGNKEQQFRDGMEKFVAEAKRLAKFQGETGIVQIYDSFFENNTAYIIMEYLEGETLTTYLEREGTIPVDAAIGLLTPLIKSLEVVHKEGIIHRDIAPDNIMVTKNGEVKLIDFGAARYATTSHSRSLTVIIKPGYSPEEQYRSRGDQGPHTDVYSSAAVLYRMITGVTPPDAMERRALVENGKKDILEAPSKYVKNLDTNVETAILNAMNVRIEDRTPDMGTFFDELMSDTPVKRRLGKIKKIDVLKWPLWAKIAVPTGLVAVIALLVLFFTGVIKFESGLKTEIEIAEGMTRVPSVVNEEVETAEERLAEATLLYEIIDKQYSSLVPADLILTQDVAGGAVVVQNTVLGITISGGAQTETVPNVLGISQEEAEKILKEAGFVVEVSESYSLTVAEGSIISQSEEAGTECEVESVITLIVSKGVDPDVEVSEESTTVSDFVGMTYEKALEEAEDKGLILHVAEQQYSDEYDEGVIMEQNLDAGETVLKGNTTVELVVSKGKHTVKVSDVQYQSEAEAKAALEKQGLTVDVSYEENDTVAEGLVISQSIKAGETVDAGSKITLTVSKGAGSFAMPDVCNMTEDEAEELLISKGLSIDPTYVVDESVEEGTVLEQSVLSGDDVKRGDIITLVISTKKETTSVADVTGKTQDEAKKTLTEQGFNVSVTEVYDDSVSAGVVISQTPAAGSNQTKNTQIVLTVSKGKEEIISISVASKPNKTVYYVGETFSATGLTLTATYNSGKKASVSSGYSCDTTTLSSAGTKTVTVSYAGKTATFTITVNEVILESISVKSKPSKTSYFKGETLSTAGLTLTASYNSGKTETIMSGFSCSPTTLNTAGTQTITVSYGGKTTSFTVTVLDVSVTSISVASKPDKTSYYVGDTLNTSGLTLKVTYSDGTSETVSSGFTCTPLLLSTAGTQKITVTYGSKTISFNVTVQENSIKSISVKQNPTTTTYYVGDTLDTTGLRLTATYASGKTETILSGYTCSPTTLTSSGTQKITVTYGGKSTSFTVSVTKKSSSSGTSGTTSTATPTPTPTATPAPTATSTATPTPKPTATSTPTPKPTATSTPTPTPTATPTPEPTTDAATTVVASGTCGDNLTWVLNGAGTLTISGSGSMYNYYYYSSQGTQAPWYSYKSKIKYVVIENGVTSIGTCAFGGCTKLEDVSFPNSLVSIGVGASGYYNGAFYNCTSLSSITLSAETIGDYALSTCEGLTNVVITSNVKDIAYNAFVRCLNISSITVDSNNQYYTSENGILFSKDKTVLCHYPAAKSDTSYTIPSTVTTIDGDAFWECVNLTNINIPNSVTYIGGNAFYACTGLSTIDLPESVTYIGEYAFMNCTMSSIVIPASVTYVGSYAFTNWGSDQTIYMYGTTMYPSGWSSKWYSYCSATVYLIVIR